MIEYLYRGFKLSYVVAQQGDEDRFVADGYATYLLNEPKSFSPVQLQVILGTYEDAEHEVKVLLEQYVNTQLQAFYATDTEAVGDL